MGVESGLYITVSEDYVEEDCHGSVHAHKVAEPAIAVLLGVIKEVLGGLISGWHTEQRTISIVPIGGVITATVACVTVDVTNECHRSSVESSVSRRRH